MVRDARRVAGVMPAAQQTQSTADPLHRPLDQILDIYTSQCFTIGLIQGVRQPLAVRTNLRNIPAEAIFNWEPQGQIGLYRPDTFFYAN